MSLVFYKKNLLDQAIVIAENENKMFPLSNLKDFRKTKVFRSVSDSVYIDFDLRETSKIDAIILLADKRSGLGFSAATIHLNNSADFTTPALSQSVSISTKFGIGLVEFSSTQEYRFARIELSSSLDYCELSKVFIGEKINLSRSINFGWQFKDKEISSSQTNKEGQEFIDLYGKQHTISFSYSLLTKDEIDQFNELFDHVGTYKPVYVLMSEGVVNDRLRHSGAFFFADNVGITNTFFNRFGFSGSLKEVL